MKYTIDLLQGQGLPPQSRPAMVALAVVPLLIPVLATVAMAACWKHNACLIETKQAVAAQHQDQIQRNQEQLDQFLAAQKQILEKKHQVTQIAKSLKTEIQISPLLFNLIQDLPQSLMLIKMDLEYNPIRRKVTDPKSGNVSFQSIIQRNLKLIVAGADNAQVDELVNSYIQTLRKSEFLRDHAQEIRIAAREQDELNEKPIIQYTIECQFKEQKAD